MNEYKKGQLVRKINFSNNSEAYFLILRYLGRDFYEVTDVESGDILNTLLRSNIGNVDTNVTILSEPQ